MPSNRELAAEAAELGEKLGVPVSVDGMSNAERVELVQNLRAQLAEREAGTTETKADEPPAPEEHVVPKPRRVVEDRDRGAHGPPPLVDGAASDSVGGPPVAKKPAAPKRSYPYTVAPGRTIQCPGGDIRAGREIRARDLVPTEGDIRLGQEHLENLVARGAVIKS